MTASTHAAIQTALTTALPQWQQASWEDYLACCDNLALEKAKLFFDQGYLFVDMTPEGIEHASSSDLFTMLFFIWFSRTGQTFSSVGRCLLEKPNTRAASPDLVLYVGEGFPRWQSGEPRRIDLTRWRVPDLVGEVSDTTLATDLDEKKQLYAALEIPEYWVVDVRGKQAIAFRLQENGLYQQCDRSVALEGLPISLLEETLEQLSQETNGSGALWFSQQIANLKVE